MARVALILICLAALICAGCMGNKDEVSEKASKNTLSAEITFPKIGTLFARDKTVSFDSEVSGGNAPYAYSWRSNIAGVLSQSKSFSMSASELKYGEHIVILKVTDASGTVVQATTNFNII
jgi:hypothetical protein